MRVIVCVGLPGSGKSTWLRKHAVRERDDLASPVLASDEIRVLLSEDVNNQGIHREVFATLRDLLRRRLALKRSITYVDATNLAPWERKPYIVLAHMHGADVEAVFFDTPVEVCVARNDARDRRVPDEVIRAMAERLTPPSKAEGFANVMVIRP